MRLIIFGELIIDKYFYSTTNRNAPEANIPVYLVSDIEQKLGGAANVAFNLNKFCDVEFISVIGSNNSLEVEKILNKNNIKYQFFKENRKLIVKNRIICNNIITNRYDIEDTFDISKNTQDEIFKYIESKINSIDGLIISDYGKGIIPKELCQKLINTANSYLIPTFIDPKVKDINKYKNCTFFKPNFKEALEILEKNEYEYKVENINDLYDKINCKYLLVTNGENGMTGMDNLKNIYYINHESKIDVVDVTGAGDTVLSVFVYIFILTKDFKFSINVSNFIAGKSIKYFGNYKFTMDDIKEYNRIIHSNQNDDIKNLSKIYKNIVFTNGCFDIIHIGHLKLLNYCKSIGDILIVGLNSDSSIKELKGNSRPINSLKDRIEFLYLLNIIDYIIVFDELTPINIIKNLKPDFLVKGGDYKKDNIVGNEYAKEVIIFDLIPNKSTSLIIKKINDI